jgi:hypothetical protein
MSGHSKRVLAAGLYLAVITLAALGLGAVIRHTVGAIAALFALVFLVPQVTGPQGPLTAVQRFISDIH